MAVPIRRDPARDRLGEGFRESLQHGGVRGQVARCSLELPCLVGRDAPDHLQACSITDERSQAVDAHVALLERRLRAACLGIDLATRDSRACRGPSGEEIEVGVDHDQPVRAQLRVV